MESLIAVICCLFVIGGIIIAKVLGPKHRKK